MNPTEDLRPDPEAGGSVPGDEAGRPRGWRDPWLQGLAIVALALTLNLAGNGRVGLWDRDEPRYATCTREMRERGDWVHPTFNAEPRYHKPVMIYWLMRLGLAVGGDNPFGARLVSGVAGALTCLAVWSLGRRMAGASSPAGLLAALALATSPIMVAESKLATIDASLALCFVVAQGFLWALARRDSARLAAGFWVALAMASLLKGPVAPILIAASGALSWWWGGPSGCWRRLRWRRGLVGYACLVLPWYLAIGLASRGEFFRFAVQTQIVQRVATAMEQHGAFPGYYALISLPMFYPWSALVPASIVLAWRRRKVDPTSGFLLGWIVGPMLVFECVSTKLMHYYLPAYPACALIVARELARAIESRGSVADWPLGRLGIRLVGALAIGGVIGLAAGALILPGPLKGPCLAMAGVLGLGSALGRTALSRGSTARGSATLVGTWAGMMALLVGWFLPSAEPYRLSRLVGEALAAGSAEHNVRPAIMTYQEPGVIYALGRPATDVEGVHDLRAEVHARGPVLLPLLLDEVDYIARDPRFSIRHVRQVEGYNLNKGMRQTLTLAVVGPGLAPIGEGGASATASATASTAGTDGPATSKR